MKRICIFVNGKFELSSFKIKIKQTEFQPYHTQNHPLANTSVYAADGGLNHLLKHNFPIQRLCWVGDKDSLNKKCIHFLKKFEEDLLKKTGGTNELQSFKRDKIITLNSNKDLSDLAAVLDIILSKYHKHSIFIEIYGGLGNRRDHEIANIEETKKFLTLLPKGGAVFFHGGVMLTSLPIKILKRNCRFFSIFDNKGLIEITGARYSGRFSLQRPSHGLSNQMTKEVLSITPLGGVSTIYFEE